MKDHRPCHFWVALVATVLFAAIVAPACAPAPEQSAEADLPEQRTSAEIATQLPTPMIHHIGLNVVDPSVSMEWYQKVWLEGEPSTINEKPALKSTVRGSNPPQDFFHIFNQVDEPAPGKWDFDRHRVTPQSPFWHIGIYADTTTMKAELEEVGVTTVPLYKTDGDPEEIWRSNESPWPGSLKLAQQAETEQQPPRPGGFGYFIGPDGELVEASGRPQSARGFSHVHFLHEQPWCAAQWYIDHLGMQPPAQRNPATDELVAIEIPNPCDVDVGTPSWTSLEQQGTLRDPRSTVRYGNGTFSAYSRQCMFGRCDEGDHPLVPSQGQVLDHVGFTIPDLERHVERLRAAGVAILEEIHPFGDTRAAMIADLDGLSIHLVEQNEN